jgi:hypothetical protein
MLFDAKPDHSGDDFDLNHSPCEAAAPPHQDPPNSTQHNETSQTLMIILSKLGFLSITYSFLEFHCSFHSNSSQEQVEE